MAVNKYKPSLQLPSFEILSSLKLVINICILVIIEEWVSWIIVLFTRGKQYSQTAPKVTYNCDKNSIFSYWEKRKMRRNHVICIFFRVHFSSHFTMFFLLIVGYKVLLLRGLSKVLIIFCMSLKNPQFQASRSLHCLKNWSRNCWQAQLHYLPAVFF